MMSCKTMPSCRIAWIDAWRAMLIVLVVAGHVFGMVAHYVPACNAGCYEFMFKGIYSFHMPAFFMLAGMMTSDVARGGAFFFWKSSRRLLVPYFFFGLVGAVVYLILMPYFGRGFVGSTGYYDQFAGGDWWHPWVSLLYGATFPGTDGFRCNSVLWFLPCLFSVKMIGVLFLRMVGPAIRNTRSVVLVILLIVFLGWASQFAPLPSLPYGLSKVLWYSPFFLTGYCLRSILLESSAKGGFMTKSFRFAMCVPMLVMFSILLWSIPDIVFSRPDLRWYIVAVALGVLGSFLSMGVAMKMPRRFSCICFQLSTTSIGIMFLHKYIVLGMMVVPGVKGLLASSLPVGLVISLTIVTVSTAVAWVISACARRVAPWTIGA